MAEKGRLSEKEKKRIYEVIHNNKLPDDREPRDIIAKDFGGNEEVYLLRMADFHGVAV